MKYGKGLAQVIESSDPEWAPYWVNYKLLKKKIKELPRRSFPHVSGNNQPGGLSSSDDLREGGGGELEATVTVTMRAGGADKEGGEWDENAMATSTGTTAGSHKTTSGTSNVSAFGASSCCGVAGCSGSSGLQQASLAAGGGRAFNANEQISALSRSPQEASFFKLVNKELQKITQFFCSVEAQMLGRLNHVREGMKLIDMDTVLGKDEASWRHLLAACIQLYKDLLRLENYAIVGWTSVSKIMKKHDKWTGFCTRHRFMQNVVHKLPFTHYPRTVEMLEEVEGMYQRVHRIRECSQFKCSSLQDEVLFIETIRDINKEVSRIQEEEHRDVGLTQPLAKKQRRERQQQAALEQQQQQQQGSDAAGSSASSPPSPPPPSSARATVPNEEPLAEAGGGRGESEREERTSPSTRSATSSSASKDGSVVPSTTTMAGGGGVA